MTIVLASVLVLPATALGQATGTPTAPAALTLSTQKAAANTQLTVNGTNFGVSEVVDVTFNGTSVGTPTSNPQGTFALSFTVPSVAAGDYGIAAKGATSDRAASTTFTVTQGPAELKFSVAQAPPGTEITAMTTGFRAGENVAITFNGAAVGNGVADTQGLFNLTFTIPATIAAGTYGGTAVGDTSHSEANATFTVTASTATPVPTAAPAPVPAPTATPVPATPPVAQTAPAMAHDERYFAQTQYRIDNDEAWSFFQRNGGVSTFGYPVSRTVTFLGCPVQFFQRQIIQVCPGAGAALMNMLDPEIFPYTRVNGSVFPGPDDALKANTPPVSDANYSEKISDFVQANVPDNANGQPVNFFQTFNTLGGLSIWGAPISTPQPDPSNPSFIYQRFQRGIMHYIAGTGTESVLLADYLKAILMNQNVPGDLLAQARESKYLGQYCPGNTMWLCRPEALGGTDLTFAFVTG
jgi:hypothetical protein